MGQRKIVGQRKRRKMNEMIQMTKTEEFDEEKFASLIEWIKSGEYLPEIFKETDNRRDITTAFWGTLMREDQLSDYEKQIFSQQFNLNSVGTFLYQKFLPIIAQYGFVLTHVDNLKDNVPDDISFLSIENMLEEYRESVKKFRKEEVEGQKKTKVEESE